MPVNFTLPADTQVPLAGNPAGDMNAVIDTLKAASAQYNVLNAAYAGGADPTGAADSTAAIQAAASAAPAGQTVTGPPGTYKVTSPITLPPGVILNGAPIADSAGFTLVPSSGFHGSSVLYCSDAVGSAGPVVKNVYIDGTSLPGGLSFTAATSGSLFTAAGSAFPAGQVVTLSGASLPGGFTATTATVVTAYYVINPSGTTFQLSSSLGGTAITVSSAGSGTVTPRTDGVRIYGNVHAAHLADLHIFNMSGWGVDSVWNPVSGGLPGAYNMQRLVISSSSLGGIALPFASDSEFIDVYVIGNHGNGWRIQSTDNAHFVGCRAEWNDGYGFYVTDAWYQGHSDSTSVWTACTTDHNQLDGLRIDATGNSPVIFTGCSFRRDGANGNSGGGNYAGIAVVGASGGATLPVIISGCVVTPGVDDAGAGTNAPQYGFRASASATSVTVDSSYLWGNTAGVNDDGTSNVFYGPGNTLAHGALTTPVVDSDAGAMNSALAPAVVTLTFTGGGTTLVNAALGNSFALTLTASTTTLGSPSNPVNGQVIRFRVIQGGAGSFTLSYASAYDFGAAGAPTLSAAAGKVDILGFEYVASLTKWCFLGAGLGF